MRATFLLGIGLIGFGTTYLFFMPQPKRPGRLVASQSLVTVRGGGGYFGRRPASTLEGSIQAGEHGRHPGPDHLHPE